MNPIEFYTSIINRFNKHKVEYMIVGGYAVIAHGYPRATIDLDIWIKKSIANCKNVIKALEDLGYEKEKCIEVGNILSNGGIVNVFRDKNKVYLISEYSSYLDFDESYNNKKEVIFENERYIFIGYKELIESKTNSGRQKDYEDVKNLKEVKKLEKNNNSDGKY